MKKLLLLALLLIAPLLAAEQRRYEIRVTPEMRRHTNILYTLYFVGSAYSFVVLYVVLRARVAHRLRDVARRVVKWKPATTFVMYALLAIVIGLLEFPLTLYAGFIVPYQFNLTNQTLVSWLGDLSKGLVLNIVVTGIIAAAMLWIIGRVERWWIVLWLASIPLMVFLVIIAPIAFDPVFNKFEPLRDASLRQALLDEASRAGIEGSRVYQVDKSKQTKTMNAYVTGVGPTTRIVIWDTLLAKMDRDEILAVMGHEMGHYVLKHIWWGLAEGVIISFVVCLLAQRVYMRGLSRWRLESKDDPAALAWILLIAAVFGFLLSPLVNGLSRRVEHEADAFGLELTHLNEASASAEVKLSEDSKFAPNPPAFIKFWLYSHPAPEERIDFALHYKPWERGEANRYWKDRTLRN